MGKFSCPQDNGFALFNGKQNTTYNEYYEINTGHADRSKYFEIEKWGPEWGRQLYEDMTPVEWWPKNSGYKGSNSANDIRCRDMFFTVHRIGYATLILTSHP